MNVFQDYLKRILDFIISRIFPGDDINRYSVAPFVPSSLELVREMLVLSEIKPGEIVFDLGSGDGRVVIMAAQEFGAIGVGIELKKNLVDQSLERVSQLDLEKRVRIVRKNLFEVDLSPADVITVNLSGGANIRLKSKLSRELRDGTRVISQAHEIAGWKPIKIKRVFSSSESKYPRTIYVYTVEKKNSFKS